MKVLVRSSVFEPLKRGLFVYLQLEVDRLVPKLSTCLNLVLT